MSESQTFFTKMVDELVEFSEHDPELSDGLKWFCTGHIANAFVSNDFNGSFTGYKCNWPKQSNGHQ